MVDAFDTTGDNTQNNNGVDVSLSYLGSAFHKFWSRCGDESIHPEDEPYFAYEKKHGCRGSCDFVTDDYGPWPFDGPLESAKVVVCYANPLYSIGDKSHQGLIARQRSGVEPLPEPWYGFYRPRIAKPIGLEIEELVGDVAVFNVCPYPSISMPERAIRFAAGLPSVWAAQKHFREVLLPKAREGKIFLVIARKHMLWGVHEGITGENIACVRNRYGALQDELGRRIHEWLRAQPKEIHQDHSALV